MRRAWLLMVASLLLSDRAISQTTGRPMPSISGIVFDSLVRHAPLAGAEVVMVESGRSTATDANGRFRFDSARPGPVRLTFYHAVLDSLGVGAAVVSLVVLDSGDATVTLTTPAASTVMRALCGTADPALGMVIGRVRDVDNRMPLPGAEVTASWSEWRLAKTNLERLERSVVARTDSTGAYRLCNVPGDVPVVARSRAKDHTTGLVQLDLSTHRVLPRDFSVSELDSATLIHHDSTAVGEVASGISGPRTRGSATMAGIVRTPDNRPVVNAEVMLLGDSSSVRTDSLGRFRLRQLPAGTQSIDIRAIGFAPAMIDVDLPTNGERTDTVTLARHAQTLAAVNVVAAGTIYDATGFEQRRATYSFGRYITAEEIRRRGNFDTHTLVSTTGPGRVRPSFGALSEGCYPVVFIDGNLVDPGTAGAADAMDMVRPRDIRGIEIYGAADGAPFQFRDPRGRCGSVVIWTRAAPRKEGRPK